MVGWTIRYRHKTFTGVLVDFPLATRQAATSTEAVRRVGRRPKAVAKNGLTNDED